MSVRFALVVIIAGFCDTAAFMLWPVGRLVYRIDAIASSPEPAGDSADRVAG